MTDEYSNGKNKKINNKSNNDEDYDKDSDFAVICSFILSHPLYFSYFIFFSPYLFKLLSFLSPLFLTTFLLFLSLLTTFIPLTSLINSKEGFFIATFNTLLEKLTPGFIDEGERLQHFEQLEMYKIVFETPLIELMEEIPDERDKFEANPVGFAEKKAHPGEAKAEDQCQSKKIEILKEDAKISKVKQEVKKFESFLMKRESEAKELSTYKDLKPKCGSMRLDHEKKISEAFHQTAGNPQYKGSFGSMRKEREWRRTLACKLFEERHNGGYTDSNAGNNDGEGMDLLWETYETESNRGKAEEKSRKGRREKIQGLMAVKDEEDEFYGGEGAEDDDNGKFCCLQALKLSAGKMNLSMGRPSLIKFGKTFKGIGWLQSPSRKQGKKGYK